MHISFNRSLACKYIVRNNSDALEDQMNPVWTKTYYSQHNNNKIPAKKVVILELLKISRPHSRCFLIIKIMKVELTSFNGKSMWGFESVALLKNFPMML